jgi:hypothetical protein
MSCGPMEAGAEDYGTSVCVLLNRHLGILIFPLWGKWFYQTFSSKEGHLVLVRNLELWESPIGLDSIMDTLRC